MTSGEEKQGLMPDIDRSGRFPDMSRDYGLNINCRRASCSLNDSEGKCGLPSHCDIGEDGMCKGYMPKEIPGEKK